MEASPETCKVFDFDIESPTVVADPETDTAIVFEVKSTMEVLVDAGAEDDIDFIFDVESTTEVLNEVDPEVDTVFDFDVKSTSEVLVELVCFNVEVVDCFITPE